MTRRDSGENLLTFSAIDITLTPRAAIIDAKVQILWEQVLFYEGEEHHSWTAILHSEIFGPTWKTNTNYVSLGLKEHHNGLESD